MHWFERHLALCILAMVLSLVIPGILAKCKTSCPVGKISIEKVQTIPVKRVKKGHD